MKPLLKQKLEQFIRKQIDATKGENKKIRYKGQTFNFTKVSFDYDLIVDGVDKHLILVFAINEFRVHDWIDAEVSKAFGQEPTQFKYTVIANLMKGVVNKKVLPALYRYFGINSVSITLFRPDRKQIGLTKRLVYSSSQNKFRPDRNYNPYLYETDQFRLVDMITKRFEGKEYNIDFQGHPLTATIHRITYRLYEDETGDCVVTFMLSGEGASHVKRSIEEDELADEDQQWYRVTVDLLRSHLMVLLNKDFRPFARAIKLPHDPHVKWLFNLNGFITY